MGIAKKIARFTKQRKHRKQIRSIVDNYLFQLENTDKSLWGSITTEDEEGIRRAVNLAAIHEGAIVEIGTLFGHTTSLLATLKHADIRLITVDNFAWNPFNLPADDHRLFTRRSLRYVVEHCNTEIFDGSATEFYAANPNLKMRMVFIDAEHEYEPVKRDIAWARAAGCPVISGHDYIDLHPGVMRAVDEAFGDAIEVYGSVWVHKQ